MPESVLFDRDLINQYGQSGPRYTSYPTAAQFHDKFSWKHYQQMARKSNEDFIPAPLSLYFHLPFCSRVCFYCACNKIITKNRAHAAPYLANLSREIRMQGELFDRDRQVEQLHWGGGTPTFINHQQMRDLMNVIRQYFTLLDDDSGDYSVEIDPREVTEETIGVLRAIGFNRISIGVQDFEPEVQAAVNRIQTPEQTFSVMANARLAGFKSINLDLIYGLPKQTPESFHSTLEKVIDFMPDRIAVYNYAHLPQLFKTQNQINAEDLPLPEQKLEILQDTINYFEQNGYVYIGMDHFARYDDELAVAQRNGTLHRNFQGYTTHRDCDLVGMGITAISKVGQCYSQNVRTLDEYSQTIEQGILPVMRGHKLDDDDELRRDVILRLICHFNLDYEDIEERYYIDFRNYFCNELSQFDEMQKHGLLSLGKNSLNVLPKGRLLIRNICMVFDKYMQAAKAENHFSSTI